MALSDNKERKFQQAQLIKKFNMNVAANTEIFEGAAIALDADGNAIPAPATGAFSFMGIAANYVDNLAPIDATTNFPLVVDSGQIEQMTMDVAPDPEDIRGALFYTDDNEVSFTKVAVTGVAGSQVGILWKIIDGTEVLVDLSKALTA